MSAPAEERPAVVLPKNSSPPSSKSCLQRERELEQLRAEAHATMFGLWHEYFEQCRPGPANDFKQPDDAYLKNVVSLFRLSVKLLKAVNSLIEWNADAMAGKAEL
jgi:hypothetical protein